MFTVLPPLGILFQSALSPVPPLDWDQSSVGSDWEDPTASLEDSTHNDFPANS
jgi:hypothetical protein